MTSFDHKVYLASGSLNDDQKRVISELEILIEGIGCELFSPSRDGITINRDSTPRDWNQVLKENVTKLEWCSIVVAATDGVSVKSQIGGYYNDFTSAWKGILRPQLGGEVVSEIESGLSRILARDVGTVWEMGYAYGSGKTIVSYSDKGYGQNVLVTESVLAHCTCMNELRDVLLELKKVDPYLINEETVERLARIRKDYSFVGTVE